MSKLEQTNARYTLMELLERGQDYRSIAQSVGMRTSDLKSFYRVEKGSDLMPREIEKLEKLLGGLS
jgi:uncharacterized protein YerC